MIIGVLGLSVLAVCSQCIQTNSADVVGAPASGAELTEVTNSVSSAVGPGSNTVSTVVAVLALPESGFSDTGGVVKVSVYLDLNAGRIKHPEGVAMLRAMKLLRKARPEIPSKYVVNGRVMMNSNNRTTGIYTYIVEYDDSAIASVVARAKADAEAEAKAVEAARLVAQRKAEEAKKVKEAKNTEDAKKLPPCADKKIAGGTSCPMDITGWRRDVESRLPKATPSAKRTEKAIDDSQSFLLEEE